MTEPTLIIMAAGMGSRYGGLKQMDPICQSGELIMDFSLYDAMMAGFKRVIFIIREEMEADLRALVDSRAGKHLKVEYAFQTLADLPEGYLVPAGRKKPWGTAHAIYSCRQLIDGPFAVINADDFYGATSFQLVYDFISSEKRENVGCMAGFRLQNTITDKGSVSRGVCTLSAQGWLTSVTERKQIMRRKDGIAFTEDGGETWEGLNPEAIVSMNFWALGKAFMKEIENGFPAALDKILEENPLKGEHLLPIMIDQLIKEEKASIHVLESPEQWYGITYQEDKEDVRAAIQALKDKGFYPQRLWD